MAQVIQATGKVAPVRAVLYLLRQRYPVRGRAGAASYGALPASAAAVVRLWAVHGAYGTTGRLRVSVKRARSNF